MRNVSAVFAGMLAGVIVVMLLEMVSSQLYTLPSNINFNDESAMHQYMLNIPTGALLMVLLGWIAGSFIGGIVATLIAIERKRTLSVITGSILTVAAISTMMMIPHPLWMWVAGIVLLVPAALLGNKVSTKN